MCSAAAVLQRVEVKFPISSWKADHIDPGCSTCNRKSSAKIPRLCSALLCSAPLCLCLCRASFMTVCWIYTGLHFMRRVQRKRNWQAVAVAIWHWQWKVLYCTVIEEEMSCCCHWHDCHYNYNYNLQTRAIGRAHRFSFHSFLLRVVCVRVCAFDLHSNYLISARQLLALRCLFKKHKTNSTLAETKRETRAPSAVG